ncbi:MAG TPA: TonB-dependent receptor [Bryobacteraceae bacterium]|nr:TonB-dependent receptor [Bryobacteraceae bacterium]
MPRYAYWLALAVLLLGTTAAWGQSQNGSLTGQVTDKTGASIPNATVTLTSTERHIPQTTQTDSEGRYSFPNDPPGTYDLTVDATGFKQYVQHGIQIAVSQAVRADATMEVGDNTTKVEVTAEVQQLNMDNGAKQEGVAPQIVNDLPLLVSAGTPRNALQFASFLPGVNTGTSVQAFNARINGGLKMGDEAVMDGVSMQEGTMSQSGIVSFFDFAQTPDMVQEVRLMTSSYEPEYGTTTGGVMIVTTKSGTDQIHASAFEYLRNRDFNATPFTNNRGAGDQRPKDNENEYGFSGGLPIKLKFLPFVWGPKHKTYFFNDTEFLRSLGGASRPLVTIPSVQDRSGNFSDWSTPIYDPRSETISNGVISRVPFSGNQIPASEQSALALQWMKYLPTPTSSGAFNNYLAQPISDGILSNLNEYLFRVDHYWGEKDHFFFTIWRQLTQPNEQCTMPVELCTSSPANPEDAWVNRFNWDHIFSPTVLSHFAYGYLNRNEGYGSVTGQNPADLPHIPNAAAYNASPAANFSGNGISNFAGWGNTQGYGPLNKSTRPSHVVNELVSWVHGAHTIKFGGEYRHLQQVFRNNNNQSGTLDFTQGSTGLPGTDSGNPFASFLTGAVDYGNLSVLNIARYGALQRAYNFHIGDTWKMTPKLTLNYGLRWDKFSPTWETSDYMSFFSFKANPDAGGLPGSVVYSGNKWGDASAGVRYPENEWNGAFAPRLGVAYAVSDKTVVRAGYGLFYTQAFYPGWGGGMSLDGFNPNVAFNDSIGGYEPAFYMDSGFPAYNKAENITLGADNGTGGPQYRPAYANHLSNTQQWNLTVEHRFGEKGFASIAYVASKGTHLPSTLQPLNVLNPSLLSMGSELNAAFTPTTTSLFGVSQPYAGWAQQLLTVGGCAPTVAQALLPFPQYCGGLTGINENEGTSHYNSMQMKYGRNLSGGLYVEGNYTLSRLTTDAASTTQSGAAGYGAVGNIISPYQGSRNMALSPDDIPNMVSVMAVYDLPFGRGKQYYNSGGPLGTILGGWTLASTMKFTSGMPLYFWDSAVCGVPSQFRAACIPAISGNVLAQSWGNVDVNKPMYNASAFTPSSQFNGFYLGTGPRVSHVRGSGYRDVNLSLARKFAIKERLHFEIRAEAFNLFNTHYFTCDGQAFGDCIPFNNDPSSSSFGSWNGTVTVPRNIQLVGRVEF